jgi:8-oxo-dGTP diphosphatase
MPYTYKFKRPSFTVDIVMFGVDRSRAKPKLQVLLIKRDSKEKGPESAFQGFWAIPGGFVEVDDEGDQGESLEEAAHRELGEETGVKVEYLEQLYTFGKPKRDPRGRVISVAYFALVQAKHHVANSETADSDAEDAGWFDLDKLEPLRPLAFDHDDILKMALQRLQAKVRYAPIGFNLMPEKFTLRELQELYEAVLFRPLDKGNFRKKVLAMSILKEVGVQGTKYRESKLYRFDKKAYNHAVENGFNFEI